MAAAVAKAMCVPGNNHFHHHDEDGAKSTNYKVFANGYRG
jgi:hypothetical protein